jgi:transcriptional regulator with XRE-family HTH domain
MPTIIRPRRIAPVDHDPAALVWTRKAAGWRQAALAQEVGISASLLCEAEKGTRGLAPKVLIDLAKALDCPVTMLKRKVHQQ